MAKVRPLFFHVGRPTVHRNCQRHQPCLRPVCPRQGSGSVRFHRRRPHLRRTSQNHRSSPNPCQYVVRVRGWNTAPARGVALLVSIDFRSTTRESLGCDACQKKSKLSPRGGVSAYASAQGPCGYMARRQESCSRFPRGRPQLCQSVELHQSPVS